MIQKFLEKVMQREKIYIFPNGYGFLYLAVIVVMILVGATYANNLIYLLGFFLFSVFVSSMVQTHNNIKDVSVEVTHIEDAFEGEQAKVSILFRNGSSRMKQTLRVIPRVKSLRAEVPGKLDILSKKDIARSYFYLTPQKRGVRKLGDLTLYTVYPMGLFYSWKYIKVDAEYFVYPKPVDAKLTAPKRTMEEILQASKAREPLDFQDDFKDHRLFLQGESEHHVDWKVYARTKEKMVKTFESPAGVVQSFNIRATRALPLEEGLSQISHWIRLASRQNQIFELVLDDEVVTASQGAGHARICYRKLASFESEAS